MLGGTPPTPAARPVGVGEPVAGTAGQPVAQPGGCEAVYEIFNQWPGGFQAWVRVTAVSAISGGG